jgi:transcriptional regulator of acetoin/glycerol metabolism
MERPTQVIYESGRAVLISRPARVRVVSGPDLGRSVTLELQRVRVGTSPDSELTLTDPLVSRTHLEFQVQDLGYLVADLGSTNGTFVGGARVREALLGQSGEVRLGSTVLRLEAAPEQEKEISDQSFGDLIGSSAAIRRVFGVLTAVARTDVTVLIEGETGTGKELVAEALHRQSPRTRGPFSVVDCGSIPPNLIESELFGHERGAFTGATGERQGAFERARGGVIFLDEIGELPLEMQTRLLRVLDRRVVKRVGGNLERKVDVRVVAATNRDLAVEVKQGRFRQDLYFRLAVVRIVLPPLRDRREDIPALARHFLWQAGCADPDAVLKPELLRVLSTRAWPGNVRELRNLVERAIVLADERGGPALLGDEEPAPAYTPAPQDATPPLPVEPPPLEEPALDGVAPAAGLDWLSHAMPAGFLEQPFKVAKEQLLTCFEKR